jgi:hypothetical protein
MALMRKHPMPLDKTPPRLNLQFLLLILISGLVRGVYADSVSETSLAKDLKIIRGVVIKQIHGCEVDGACSVLIRMDNGKMEEINWSGLGDRPNPDCIIRGDISEAAAALKPGQKVEIHLPASSNNMLCGDQSAVILPGMPEEDFAVLDAPSKKRLEQTVINFWNSYASTIATCPDLKCYESAQNKFLTSARVREISNSKAVLPNLQREFQRERDFFNWWQSPETVKLDEIRFGFRKADLLFRFLVRRKDPTGYNDYHVGCEAWFSQEEGSWKLASYRRLSENDYVVSRRDILVIH